MKVPCFQHDSYDSACSSCRELNSPQYVRTKPEDWRVRLALAKCRGKGLTLSKAEVRALYDEFFGREK